MKKVLLFIALLFFFGRLGQAQSLTVEYNIGHGSYQMSDMEDFLNRMELPVSNAQVTDNFPGYVTQDTRVGLEWSRHHAGVLFNYMNTAGKKGITDYSGSCNFELRNKGYKLGAFYRFRLVKEEISIFTFEPYIQFSAGQIVCLSNPFPQPDICRKVIFPARISLWSLLSVSSSVCAVTSR